jgi:DNA-binding Lrp family transcriptional regulator
MVQRVALGATIREIASEFHVSPRTVRERLQLAREAGVLQQAQVIILEKLVPLAVAAYAHALQDESGNAELRLKAAKDVLFGAGALESKSSSTVVHQADLNTLEAFRAERAARQPEGVIVDAEIENSHAAKRLGP